MFTVAERDAVRERVLELTANDHASIARGRVWQADHWITAVRDDALALERAARSLVAGHDPAELRRALRAAVELLLVGAGEAADHVAPRLRELVG